MMRSTRSISDSLGRRTTNCSQSPGVRNESSLLPTWTIRASLRCSKPTVPASSCSAEVRTRTERCSRCSTGSWPAPPHSTSNIQSLSSITSASVAARCLSASNRQCKSAGPVRGLDYPQNGGRIHPTPEPDDERPGRNVCFSTVPLLVNAEDQIRQSSTPIQREFPGHVVGCPEAHDLQEPVACRIGAQPQGKVGEDQRAPGRYRLRLANHIPCRCQLSELTSEALFQMAVVSARRAGRKDRITRPELQGEAAPAQDAFRLKPEAWTPCKQRHEFAERPSIQPGVVKQRERSREFQRGVRGTRPFDARADQSSPLRLADQGPRVPLHFDPHNGRAKEERLNQREVASERQLHRRQRLRRRTDEPFAREVAEQRISQVLRGHPQGGGNRG